MGKRSRKPMSMWDILGGTSRGYRYETSGGASITANKASDKKRASGGRYVSVTRADGGKKTAVYDRNGRKVHQSKNSLW